MAAAVVVGGGGTGRGSDGTSGGDSSPFPWLPFYILLAVAAVPAARWLQAKRQGSSDPSTGADTSSFASNLSDGVRDSVIRLREAFDQALGSLGTQTRVSSDTPVSISKQAVQPTTPRTISGSFPSAEAESAAYTKIKAKQDAADVKTAALQRQAEARAAKKVCAHQ